MSQQPKAPLFSADLHEIGTRIVDLLNQTGFLYRYPALSGVTLACIAQHLGPMKKLLEAQRPHREEFGARQSAEGYTVGAFTRPDPVGAAFDHAEAGYRTFVRHLQRAVSASPDASDEDQRAMQRLCDLAEPPDAEFILCHKALIESHAEQAVRGALAEFHPLSDDDWQGLRMVLFFFLLEFEKSRRA